MRLVVAAPSRLVAVALKALLEARGHVVEGAAHGGAALLQLVIDVAPDAAVIWGTPAWVDGSAAAAAIALRNSHPHVGVLILGGAGPLPVGALPLSGRVDDAAALDAALARVARGGLAVELPTTPPAPLAVPALTAREREVLGLLAAGLSNQGIADRLRLTTNTVGTHLQHVFDKLGLPDTPAANRRVLAALVYLAHGSRRAPAAPTVGSWRPSLDRPPR